MDARKSLVALQPTVSSLNGAKNSTSGTDNTLTVANGLIVLRGIPFGTKPPPNTEGNQAGATDDLVDSSACGNPIFHRRSMTIVNRITGRRTPSPSRETTTTFILTGDHDWEENPIVRNIGIYAPFLKDPHRGDIIRLHKYGYRKSHRRCGNSFAVVFLSTSPVSHPWYHFGMTNNCER